MIFLHVVSRLVSSAIAYALQTKSSLDRHHELPPHLRRQCPHRESTNALVAVKSGDRRKYSNGKSGGSVQGLTVIVSSVAF